MKRSEFRELIQRECERFVPWSASLLDAQSSTGSSLSSIMRFFCDLVWRGILGVATRTLPPLNIAEGNCLSVNAPSFKALKVEQ